MADAAPLQIDGAAADAYLSFDCATKTFAFVLLAARRDWAERLASARAPAVSGAVAGAAAGALVRVLDMDTVDLFPGRADAGVHTVERLRALVAYLRARVDPALRAAAPGRATVLIEYQMGQNSRARAVAHALCAHYCDHDVRFIGAALKNTLYLAPELTFAHFAGQNGAVKKHTIANFKRAMELSPALFDFGARACDVSRRSEHQADAFAQALVYLLRGLHDAPHAF